MIYDCYNYPPEAVQEIERLKTQVQNLQWAKEKVERELKDRESENEHLSFRIRHELEPRIQAEEYSYDSWVTNDPAPEAEDHWQLLLSEMIDMVEENPCWFDWEDGVGEIDEKVLYVIKHRNCKVVSESDYEILQNAR